MAPRSRASSETNHRCRRPARLCYWGRERRRRLAAVAFRRRQSWYTGRCRWRARRARGRRRGPCRRRGTTPCRVTPDARCRTRAGRRRRAAPGKGSRTRTTRSGGGLFLPLPAAAASIEASSWLLNDLQLGTAQSDHMVCTHAAGLQL